MELTLTGGSTLGDKSFHRSPTPVHSNGIIGASSSHNAGGGGGDSHGRSHPHHHAAHDSSGAACCHAHAIPRPAPKVTASTLLPTREVVSRFRTDKTFRMNVLSNVVRGGPYELFTNLLTVLVVSGDANDADGGGDGGANANAPSSGGGSKVDGEGGTRSDEVILKEADQELLARMLDGYGADGHTLAHWCAKRGDEPRFLSFLIEKSYNGARLLIDVHLPSKDAVGMYPLHWAVTEGAIPLVGMLLQHLEERPSSSLSPHQRLSTSTSAPPASSLMQEESEVQRAPSDVSGAANSDNVGIDATDASGCTPLLIASQYGHPDLAAFLIRRGANPQAVDANRDTALHWAAYKGSVEVCGMLLHLLGVTGQLDAVDSFGQTPLHLASLRGNAETVQFLMEEADSIGEGLSSGGSLEQSSSSVGSKMNRPSAKFYPGKLLSTKDNEGKTPRDLAIKKKKVGCEMLLLEYEEQYLTPSQSIFSRLGRTFRDLCSMRSWKAWMGMTGSGIPLGQSPTFPFYWMTIHIFLGGMFYATEFAGVGGKGGHVVDDALLLDKMGLHLFFLVASAATWINLYLVYRTNPGVLDATRNDNNAASSYPSSTCQSIFCRGSGAGYSKDKISLEMVAVTKELRRQYDEIIESYSKDFPSHEKRVPLCHTCRIAKPLRSKHCRVARRCVLVFDHHCPFVGTTIGLYNYIYFYLFLLSFVLMVTGFIAAWITFLKRSKIFPKGVFLMGGYMALYLIPVGFMLMYHTSLISNNITTNEQMNLRKYQYLRDESGRFHNPFNRGKIRNVLQRCAPDRSSYELAVNHRGSVESMNIDDEERQSMLSNMV